MTKVRVNRNQLSGWSEKYTLQVYSRSGMLIVMEDSS